MDVLSKPQPCLFKELWHMHQIFLRRPDILSGQSAFSRLIGLIPFGDTIRRCKTGHAALQADGEITFVDVSRSLIERLANLFAIRMCIDEDTVPASATEQVIN